MSKLKKITFVIDYTETEYNEEEFYNISVNECLKVLRDSAIYAYDIEDLTKDEEEEFEVD